MIKYSVIIPAFNIESYVSNLVLFIDKILLNRDDVEFIFINDGSSDNTDNLLCNLDNIVYIKQNNKGVSSARNKGLKRAEGKYVLFLDADDEFHDDIFNILDDKISPDLDIYLFNYSVNDDVMNIEVKEGLYYNDFIVKSIFMRDFRFTICSTCIKRSFILNNNIKFKEGFAWGEDTHFVLKALLRTKENIYYLNTVLFNYNLQLGGAMSSTITYDKAKSIFITDDLVNDIDSLDVPIKDEFLYYSQRGYIYMIKKAFANNIDSCETLDIYKNYIPILDVSVNIKTPFIFRLSRFIVMNFSGFLFELIKIKSKI